jgi:hypothetical protein
MVTHLHRHQKKGLRQVFAGSYSTMHWGVHRGVVTPLAEGSIKEGDGYLLRAIY